MNIFKSFGEEFDYSDILQLDGCFSVAHINYGKSPLFNGLSGKAIARDSREQGISSEERIDDVLDSLHSFDGTEKNFNEDDRIASWKHYWLEYINAFDAMANSMPDSIVTAFIGRQAIEIGIKYLLLKRTNDIVRTHDLKVLSEKLFEAYGISEEYMEDMLLFCSWYSTYLEGENEMYFRYPEYRGGKFFAGNNLDIKWLSYNFALLLLKLIHFADLEAEFE